LSSTGQTPRRNDSNPTSMPYVIMRARIVTLRERQILPPVIQVIKLQVCDRGSEDHFGVVVAGQTNRPAPPLSPNTRLSFSFATHDFEAPRKDLLLITPEPVALSFLLRGQRESISTDRSANRSIPTGQRRYSPSAQPSDCRPDKQNSTLARLNHPPLVRVAVSSKRPSSERRTPLREINRLSGYLQLHHQPKSTKVSCTPQRIAIKRCPPSTLHSTFLPQSHGMEPRRSCA